MPAVCCMAMWRPATHSKLGLCVQGKRRSSCFPTHQLTEKNEGSMSHLKYLHYVMHYVMHYSQYSIQALRFYGSLEQCTEDGRSHTCRRITTFCCRPAISKEMVKKTKWLKQYEFVAMDPPIASGGTA